MSCSCGCHIRAAQYGDSECVYTLEAEEQRLAEEEAIATQDNIETLGIHRYGHKEWFWNKPYVWKSEGYADDEIPF